VVKPAAADETAEMVNGVLDEERDMTGEDVKDDEMMRQRITHQQVVNDLQQQLDDANNVSIPSHATSEPTSQPPPRTICNRRCYGRPM